VSLAFTRSQRAPQVQELFFEGLHDATRTFQRGNSGLALETSHNLDLGYTLTSNLVTAQVNLFHNWINDYIFLQRTGAIVSGSPEQIFQQANATFMGYEAKLIFPVLGNNLGTVDLTLFSDFTRAKLTDGTDVPQTPPLRFGFQVDHAIGNLNSNFRLTRAQAQNNPGPNEADTPAYLLLNLNSHYHIDNVKGADVLVYAKGNNLLNQNIRNSASFLRNFAPEPGVGAELGIRINY